MNKREQITMSAEERRAMLADSRTIILSSIGADGYPHSVAMWFDFDEDETIWMATFGKSQKALNLRRNPRVSLLVEAGTAYEELRGVLIRGDAEIIDDPETTHETLCRVFTRTYGGLADAVTEELRTRARKRVTVRVRPRKISSWDHRKTPSPY